MYLEVKYVILVHSKNQCKVGNACFQLSTIRIAGRDKQCHVLASDQVSRLLEDAEAHHRELCHSFLMLADIGNIWNTRYVFQAGSHRLI